MKNVLKKCKRRGNSEIYFTSENCLCTYLIPALCYPLNELTFFCYRVTQEVLYRSEARMGTTSWQELSAGELGALKQTFLAYALVYRSLCLGY